MKQQWVSRRDTNTSGASCCLPLSGQDTIILHEGDTAAWPRLLPRVWVPATDGVLWPLALTC